MLTLAESKRKLKESLALNNLSITERSLFNRINEHEILFRFATIIVFYVTVIMVSSCDKIPAFSCTYTKQLLFNKKHMKVTISLFVLGVTYHKRIPTKTK